MSYRQKIWTLLSTALAALGALGVIPAPGVLPALEVWPALDGHIAFAADAENETRLTEAVERAAREEVYIGGDDSVRQMFERAEALAREERWLQAAAAYESVIDRQQARNQSAFVLDGADLINGLRYVSAAAASRRRLAALPDDILRQLAARADAKAAEDYERALAARDVQALKDVASRYSFTPYSAKALNAAGDTSFANGRMHAAAQLWQRTLMLLPQHDQQIVAVAVKLAFARALLGDTEAAANQLQRLPRDAQVNVGGGRRTVGELIDSLPLPMKTATGDDWPVIAGNARATGNTEIFDVGRMLWSYESERSIITPENLHLYRKPAARAVHQPDNEAPRIAGGSAVPAIHYPVAAGGMLYINTGLEISAIEIATGTLIWRFAPGCEIRAVRELTGSAAIDGDRLFAAVGERLYALDRRTGIVIWEATGETDPLFGGDVLLTQPAVASGRVFVGVTSVRTEGEAFLAVLDADDGSFIGKVFLCSHSVPRHIGLGARGSTPSTDGDRIVYCTNLGVVAAIDVHTLDVAWLWRYPFARPHLKQLQITREMRWAANPPAITGDTVLVAPQDGQWLYALNLHDGTVQWRQPRQTARYFIAPQHTGRVYLAGETVAAVDLRIGKMLWVSRALDGAPAGRPAAGAGGILVPTNTALFHYDAGGRLVSRTSWDSPLDAGNLCIASGRLITGTVFGAAAFESWDASLERLGEPNAYDLFRLGQLYARRGNLEQAIARLQQSLASVQGDTDDHRRFREALRNAFEQKAAGGELSGEAEIELHRHALEVAPFAQDRLRHLAAIARLQTRLGANEQAAATWQRVIREHPHALQQLPDGLNVRAAVVARQEIEKLIAEYGLQVYAQHEAAAGRLLAESAGLEADLESIVQYFPNSTAAGKAAGMLARMRADAGFPNDAANYLQHAADVMPKRLRAQVMISAVEILNASDRADLALVFIEQLLAGHSDEAIGSSGLTVAEFCRRELQDERYGRITDSRRKLFSVPLRQQWRSAVRMSSATPRIIPSDFVAGTPYGKRSVFYVLHSDAAVRPAAWPRAVSGQYDYIECRTSREGYLVWARGMARWDGVLHFTADHVIAMTGGAATAFDALTGEPAWEYSSDGADRDFHGITAVAADADRVYVVTSDGTVAALDDRNGNVAWRGRIENTFILRNGAFALGGRLAVFSENPGGIHLFDTETGGSLISQRIDLPFARITTRPLHVQRHNLFAAQLSDSLFAGIDDRTGRIRWRVELFFSAGTILTDPAERYIVIAPDRWVANGKLMVIDAGTGQILWQRAVAHNTLSGIAVDSRGVYTLESEGRLQKVRFRSLETGETLAPDYVTDYANLENVEVSGDLIILSGALGRPRVIVLDRTGREVFSTRPGGADYLAARVVGASLVVSTDRGSFGYGRVDRSAAEAELAAVAGSEKIEDMQRAAQAASELGNLPAAIDLLSEAMESAPSDADYLRIYDKLSGMRDELHEVGPPVLNCVRMLRPPAIDGVLAEDWNESTALRLRGPKHMEVMLPGPNLMRTIIGGIESITGNGFETGRSVRIDGDNDLSIDIYSGWDKDNLYLAIDVTDRTHRLMDRERPQTWTGDSVIIGIDATNSGGYGYTWGNMILTLGLADKPKDDEGDEDKPEGDFSIEFKDDKSGVVFEVSIPWSYLRFIKPEAGSEFGMGITATDDDGDGVTKSMSWTPGMYLHTVPEQLSRSFSPELLGKVKLVLPDGLDEQLFDIENEEDKE